ncbi:hypothetical protein EPN96_12335 [bacterium]|nr:MAG: hypothetical protein EPN96_12335 [bacterium]
MKRTAKALLTAFSLFALAAPALSTPSTQIWIPSTDIQAYGVTHLTVDSYIRTSQDDPYFPPVFVFGPTIGVLPYEKIQMEVGFDLIYNGVPEYDSHPIYGHLKIGTPEGSMFESSPALAVGGYNFGTEKDLTNQNIIYGLVAKNIPVLGRLSVGYYQGNEDVLGDDDSGILASWDRSLPEISDKLWAAIDYQGGDNALGALSFGFSYAFAPNASVIFGYDMYNDNDIAGEDTYTVQVDLNF